MARRASTDDEVKVRREKAVRKVSLGPEPEWPNNSLLLKDEEIDVLVGNALNWYNYKSSPSERRGWLVAWMEKEKFPEAQIEKIQKISDREFLSHPAGQIARCFLQGAPLRDYYKNSVTQRIKTLLAAIEEEKHEPTPAKKTVPKVSKRDPIVCSLINIVEAKLDDFMENEDVLICDYKGTCDKLGASKEQAKLVAQRFNGRLEEIRGALKGDPELKEGYSNFKKSQLTTMVFFFEGLNDQAEEVVRSAPKVVRKQRVKKPKDLVKKVLKKDEYKVGGLTLKSIDPEEIIGAKELWVYNTKYRRLGRYIAKDEKGLSIKGTRVQNFDEENAWNKKIKKPAELLPKFIAAGKVALRTFLENIETKVKRLRPRINQEVVILKSIK